MARPCVLCGDPGEADGLCDPCLSRAVAESCAASGVPHKVDADTRRLLTRIATTPVEVPAA